MPGHTRHLTLSESVATSNCSQYAAVSSSSATRAKSWISLCAQSAGSMIEAGMLWLGLLHCVLVGQFLRFLTMTPCLYDAAFLCTQTWQIHGCLSLQKVLLQICPHLSSWLHLVRSFEADGQPCICSNMSIQAHHVRSAIENLYRVWLHLVKRHPCHRYEQCSALASSVAQQLVDHSSSARGIG